MSFRKTSNGGEGGGGIFNPKNYVAENFKLGFLSMKLIKKSHFLVQVMFVQQLYWKNQNKTQFEESTSESPPLPPSEMFCKFITPQNGPFLWKSYMHVFHTIWPSYRLAYKQPSKHSAANFWSLLYPLWKICNIIFRKWGERGQRPFGIFPKIH